MTVFLLNPGPVTLSARVRESLLGPDLCHREPEFFDLQDAARAGLLGVYDLDPAEWAAVLLTGSGTAAVESMVASVVPADGRVLVLENGVYGERMTAIAECHGIAHETLTGDWLDGPDLDALDARLAGSPGFTHVAVVHHETTTGRLTDLAAIGAVCRARGVRLLVDGVSSFGGEEIDFGLPIDAVAGTANKCLHGVPGIAFVVVRRAALASGAKRAYYLDLIRLATLQDQRNTPFTPAVQSLYALVEALAELREEGGWRARHQRYARYADAVGDGLRAVGVAPLIPDGTSSVVLRSYRLPETVGYADLHDGLKDEGFVIYAGQGELAKSIFRISTMGDLHDADVERLAEALTKAFS
ncbi:2-aminoethylphosphonate aminotransferase [Pseudonocardia sp. RS11V-5]|uniref:2-aminoethylphosphonate aminotransferase n=1 Tax=Pseudonocardia terrae TaxID=2905831 RepID=UPI001E5A8CE7|nr:2-aminoethylphosphonate aminotransferase [Pseudonocardia terrae]MCE3553463.1 2-aminoethylphosphonate aminotransferase [Pseudonocardia terrae]